MKEKILRFVVDCTFIGIFMYLPFVLVLNELMK